MMLPMVSSAMNRFRTPRRSPSADEASVDAEEPQAPKQDNEESYFPSLHDVLRARHLLRWKIVPAGLPLEIVDMIMDAAEYWASVEYNMQGQKIIRQDRDQVLVRTGPLCYDVKTLDSPSPKLLPHRTIHPCRKIIFSIASHDQGWGGSRRADSSPFEGSFTWFDVEVIHSAHEGNPTETLGPPEVGENGIRFTPSHPLLNPSSRKLQSNRTYARQTEHYTITWHHLDHIPADSVEAEEVERLQGRGRATLDGSQVCMLGLGDAISVWGRARYGGWSNHVEQASVRVFWAV